MVSFLEKLKRSKLTQWTIAYLGGAWILLEAFGFVAEQFGWPPFVVKIATVLLGAGVPIVVVLAWFHGERGRQKIRWTEVAFLGVTVGLAGLLVHQFVPTDSAIDTERTESIAESGSPPERSIAVLPFENRSGLAEDVYFTDGIHEELMMRLARLGSLRVISRTSVVHFQSQSRDLQSIGAALRVRYIVEGGVQRAGNTVRITTRLIDVQEDKHLWAETYDRELTVDNLFRIQSDVATAVAKSLNVELSANERAGLMVQDTSSLEAYNHYLLGKQLQNRLTGDGLWKSIHMFEQALEKDPRFARAHAAIAQSYMWLAHGFGNVRPREMYESAKLSVIRAFELDPDSAEANMTLGHLMWEVDWAPESAEKRLRTALELNPSSADANNIMAYFLLEQGRVEESRHFFDAGYALNPLSANAMQSIASPDRIAGDPERAIEQYEKTLIVHPDDWLTYLLYGRVLANQGRFVEAIVKLETATALNPDDVRARAHLAYALARSGERIKADKILADMLTAAESGYLWPLAPAIACAGLGNTACALDWLEAALRDRVTQLVWLDSGYPEFEELSDEPRFRAILEKINSANPIDPELETGGSESVQGGRPGYLTGGVFEHHALI